MTTIATDGRTIAWDGRITTQWGFVLSWNETKVKIEGGRVYGISGGYAVFDELIRWYAAGHDPRALPPSPESDPWVLLVHDAGEVVGAVTADAVPAARALALRDRGRR